MKSELLELISSNSLLLCKQRQTRTWHCNPFCAKAMLFSAKKAHNKQNCISNPHKMCWVEFSNSKLKVETKWATALSRSCCVTSSSPSVQSKLGANCAALHMNGKLLKSNFSHCMSLTKNDCWRTFVHVCPVLPIWHGRSVFLKLKSGGHQRMQLEQEQKLTTASESKW